MLNLRIWLACAAAFSSWAASNARAADDLQVISAQRTNEFQIVLSGEGVKRAERREQLDLYRRAMAGNEEARAAWRKIKPDLRTDLLAELAVTKNEEKDLRKHALRDLALLPSSEDAEGAGLAALARNAVAEASGALREYARQELAARNDPRAIPPLAEALSNGDGLVRSNAALALKALGGPRVFEVIIEHWKEVWGASPHDHFLHAEQRGYISGYTISGATYDPTISTLLTGVVLDAKIQRVERNLYYITIREIAPDDVKLPNNPAAWQEWLEKERPKLARAAEKKHYDAVAMLCGLDEE